VDQIEQIEDWRGSEVVASDGERLGKLDDLLYDNASGEAELVVVKSGRLNVHRVAVPLVRAVFGRNRVRLGFTGDQISQAPGLDDESPVVRRSDELAIARHYGLQPSESSVDDNAIRYETATAIEQRRATVDEALRRAEQLEALAAQKQDETQALTARAASAQQSADVAETDRQQLLNEAARLRAQAGSA
jgi:sporulation protein YlmC with PRC-barrel domain